MPEPSAITEIGGYATAERVNVAHFFCRIDENDPGGIGPVLRIEPLAVYMHAVPGKGVACKQVVIEKRFNAFLECAFLEFGAPRGISNRRASGRQGIG
jgi:hypothetical protein